MANTTITALPAATTPLAGTEVVPIVQSGVTKKVAASDIAVSGGVNSFQTSLSGLTPSTATAGVVTLAGTLRIPSGGTGLTTFTAGDLPYYASGTALSKLGIGTAGQVLTSTGAAPQWSTLSGVTVTTFSAGTTGFTPSSATSGAVTLAGTLATTNGGTGLTSFTSGGAVYATSTSALTTGTLPTTAGGTALTSFTSGGVVYASSSSALTTGSALTFDGTNLGLGITPAATYSKNFQIDGSSSAGIRLTSTSYTAGFDVVVSAGDAYLLNRNNTALIFGTNGTERMRLDSSGNLGLGVTPSAWSSSVNAVQIKGASLWGLTTDLFLNANSYWTGTGYLYVANGFASDYYQQSGNHVWRTAPSGTAGNAITFTQAMTLDASGNLLVGTTSTVAGAAFVVSKSVSDYLARFINSNATAYGVVVNYSGASPNSTGQEFFRCVDSTADRMLVRSNGGIANYSANNVNLSDRREKTNFTPATSYLDKICAIPVQTFNYIDQNMEDDGGLTLGVVAQDVQAVAPELVMESNWASKDDEPKMRLSIYQTDLQYALMKCIQEQQAMIQSLTDRITQLEAK
jgi:hypothetical protein